MNTNNAIGFIPDIVTILQKYGIKQHLDTFVTNGSFPSKYTWKQIVKSVVRSKQWEMWSGRTDTINFSKV